MKVIMYGTKICTDCIEALELLDNHSDIDLDYRNITGETTTLKEFLAYRDHDNVFATVIEGGNIGIPFFILEDGTKTFNICDIIDKNTI